MSGMPQQNPLHEIADWTTTIPADWSGLARKTTENAIIDTLACTLAGAQETVIQKLLLAVRNWGNGSSTVIGHPQKLSSPWAALINGASAHALDFDDNFDPAKAHASAVLVPALIALGEEEDLTFGALVDAYIVGLQVMGHVGQAVNPFHRSRGWHATATLGAIGAAAGAARLLRLPADQTAHAISMSTSRAGGFMSQFGTDTKPLHAGFAASGGIQSALMARAGLTAGTETLEGPTSLRKLMVGLDVDDLAIQMQGAEEYGQSVSFVSDRIKAPLHVEAYGLKIKRFPNCGSVHRALDGLLDLRNAHGLTAGTVDHIMVRAPAAHLRNLMYEDPTTPAEAKFSLEYNLAVGLLQGAVGLADFSEDAIRRTHVRDLYPKIRKEYIEKLESEFPTEVHVLLKDGRSHMTCLTMPVGSKDRPLTQKQLIEKFDDCVSNYVDWQHASDLRDHLETADYNLGLKELTNLLRQSENQISEA